MGAVSPCTHRQIEHKARVLFRRGGVLDSECQDNRRIRTRLEVCRLHRTIAVHIELCRQRGIANAKPCGRATITRNLSDIINHIVVGTALLTRSR